MTPRHELPTPGPTAELAAMVHEGLPTLTTERLRLRAPLLADFAACAEIACGARGKFVGGPMSREDAWSEFAKMAAGWLLHGHGAFTVEDRETGQVYGFMVLGLEPGDQEVELGYSFTEAGEGKGLAFEAAIAVREWAACDLKLTGLVSYVAAENTRSIALATRLGAVRDPKAETALDESDTYVFRHPGPETPQ